MKHNGGPCPFKPDQMVQYAIRAAVGARFSEYPVLEAGKLRWSHDGGGGDVVFAKAVNP